MEWLRRILGLPSASARNDLSRCPSDEKSTGSVNLTIRNAGARIAMIDANNFIGQHSSSPNGRFTLLWQDRASICGTTRCGRYILLDRGRIVLDFEMARPQDGKVADNGTFILNDWGASDELSGSFHAFSSDGRQIARRDFAANLLNNGLSNDGALAVVQTCNAPGSPDSSVLAVFDLITGKELACWQPISGWADGYEFPGGDRVRMLRRNRPSLDYRLDGEFLDRLLWYSDGVSRGEHHVIKDALENGEATTGLTSDELRRGIEVAVANADDRFMAQSLRLLGEFEELVGDERAALAAYRRALANNPRIGVAKRASALEKRLNA